MVVLDLVGSVIGYSPRIVMYKRRKEASSSVTSIGTEENLLRVLLVRDEALIYMSQPQRPELQVQRELVIDE